MKNLILFSVIFYSSLSLASQTCTGQKVVDLAEKGGPLYPLRTTNQNGLGICHIEQLHKLLKAKVPGHPDLSRVQLAIAEKKRRDHGRPVQKNAVRWRDKNGIGGTYIDAGNTCDAFNLIKGESICPAGNDRFEQLTQSQPYNQEKILETLSEYFDSRPKFPTFGVFLNSYSETDFEKKLNYGFEVCPVDTEVFNSLKNAYISHIKDQKTWLGILYSKKLQDAQKLTPGSLKMSARKFNLGTSYESHLQNIFPKNKSALYSETAKALDKKITAAASEMKKNEACVVSKLNEQNNSPLCLAPIGKSTMDVLNLTSLGMNLREVTNIIDGDRDRDSFFSEAFACSSKKVNIPTDLNCNKIDLTEYSAASKTKDQYEKQVAGIIDNKIGNGTPIGISTCTRYFKDPSVSTMVVGTKNYNCGDSKAPGYKKGEGSHAVTIIGSRCHNGIKEYLVQNSWGSSCSSYHTSYECTGKGGFWTPASVVINNTRMLNILE